MAAAFTLAGFEAWDVNMVDLMEKKVSLSAFRGVAFVGGFSYADVCGSAKGRSLIFTVFSFCLHVFLESCKNNCMVLMSLRLIK